jgi:hypothetical protein
VQSHVAFAPRRYEALAGARESRSRAYGSGQSRIRLADAPDELRLRARCRKRRIHSKYGLVSQSAWPVLSTVISDGARKTVADAYGALQDSAKLAFWSVVSLVWFPLNAEIIPGSTGL